MPFLLSLFCRQGADNRLRFFAINLASYFSFLIFNNFIDIKLLSLLSLALTSYTLTMTTLRRLKDAKLTRNWLLIVVVSYALIGGMIVFIDNSAINWLILLPVTLSALLLTYPSKKNDQYILGYSGPVDLSQYKTNLTHQHHSRVEPVFSENVSSFTHQRSFKSNEKIQPNTVNSSINHSKNHSENNKVSQTQIYDLGEKIREKLVVHGKVILLSFSIFALLIIATSIVKTTSSSQQTQLIKNQLVQNKAALSELKLEHLYPLLMPDNFTLYLSQYHGLIIYWQGDASSSKQYWSIASAQEDDSCQSIRFNKGKTFRALSVNVENEIDHYASFSPLDTQPLLQAIAFRGSFSLCDFTFSLKGSQAALNKNNQYAEFIEY